MVKSKMVMCIVIFFILFLEDVHAYFSKFGEVADVMLKTDQETGRSRGFGFVVFQDKATIEDVS